MSYPHRFLLALPLDMGVAAFFFWVAAGLGLWCDRRLEACFSDGAAQPSALERTLLALGLGYAALCYGLWVLSWSGLGGPAPVVGVLSVLAWFLRGFLERSLQWVGSARRELADALSSLPKAFRVFLIGVAACVAVQQMVSNHAPTLERDDLSYHLYLPKAILAQGSLAAPPFAQRQSFYLQLSHMAYLPAMSLGGELGVKSLNYFWWLALPLLLPALARRLGLESGAGIVAAIGLWASPMTLYLGETGMTDMVIAYQSLAGLLALLLYQDGGGKKFLVFSALLTAFALTKYTAWAYGLATVALFAWGVRSHQERLFAGMLLYASAVAAVLSLQMGRLWMLKGNPLYPIPLFSLPHDAVEAAAQAYLRSQPKGWAALGRYLWDLWPNAYFLYDVPLMTLAPLFLLVPSLPRTRLGLAALWSLIPFAAGFLSSGVAGVLPRYMLATHALWLLLAAAVWWQQLSGEVWRRRLFLGFLAAGLLVPSLAASTFRAVAPLQLHLGRDTAGGYLHKFYPSEGWETVRFIDGLPRGSRVAVLDHHFMPYHYSDLARSLWPVSLRLLEERSPERILSMLSRAGVSHVLFVSSQWRPVRTPRGVIWNAVYMGSFVQCRWWADAPELPFLWKIFQGRGGIVYKVIASTNNSPAAAPARHSPK